MRLSRRDVFPGSSRRRWYRPRPVPAPPDVGDNPRVGSPRSTRPGPAAQAPAGAPGSGSAALQPEFRSGFACFVGRPNVGKSTLMNALVGTKVAITSSRPQTTRRAIRGIVHRPDAQLIIVDTPGLHRPRTLLGERLDSLVRSTLTEVDVIGFCVPATDPVGPGDKYLTRALVSPSPAAPPLYPDGERTDEPEQIMVAELIREAALDGVRDELPHSIAVVVEEMGLRPGRDDLTDIYADLYVERPSQKAIVIGSSGARLKAVGTQARGQIEALLGTRVFLDLHVRIAKDWQRNPKHLRRLGF